MTDEQRPRRRSMLEQALRRVLTPGRISGLPGMVDTCHWYECEEPAPRGLRNVGVQPPGSQVIRYLRRVPLCTEHLAAFNETGRILLKYHPDDVPSSITHIARTGD